MGIQAIGPQGVAQQSPIQSFSRKGSWCNHTVDEESQSGNLGKRVGSMSMNFDDLLKNVWTSDTNHPTGLEASNGSSASSLQSLGSLSMPRTWSEKIVDDIWKDVQQEEKMKASEVVVKTERDSSLGGMTLEDFLTKAGAIEESSLSPVMGLDTVDAVTKHDFSQEMGLSPALSVGMLSDTPVAGHKRDAADLVERSIEKKLKRKIKNRESAARSRARKQAYHNELVSKVSHLEEQNMRLKKEKVGGPRKQSPFLPEGELENLLTSELCDEIRYQLRRTSSSNF